MAPTVIYFSFPIPLSVTFADTIFAPAATAASAVTTTAPSSAIVAVTIQVPPYWVPIIFPLPRAIVSLTIIPPPLNLNSQRNYYEVKKMQIEIVTKTDT